MIVFRVLVEDAQCDDIIQDIHVTTEQEAEKIYKKFNQIYAKYDFNIYYDKIIVYDKIRLKDLTKKFGVTI